MFQLVASSTHARYPSPCWALTIFHPRCPPPVPNVNPKTQRNSVWEGHPAKAIKKGTKDKSVHSRSYESIDAIKRPCTVDVGALILEVCVFSPMSLVSLSGEVVVEVSLLDPPAISHSSCRLGAAANVPFASFNGNKEALMTCNISSPTPTSLPLIRGNHACSCPSCCWS